MKKKLNERKVSIHTNIRYSTYEKILEYGNGVLNEGIEKILEIAENKQYNVKKELERIANAVLSEIHVEHMSECVKNKY